MSRQKSKKIAVRARWAVSPDYKPIMMIDEACFGERFPIVHDDPTDKHHIIMYKVALREEERSNPNHELLGYILYECRFHSGYYRILRIAVLPAYRRMRVGTQLINSMAKKPKDFIPSNPPRTHRTHTKVELCNPTAEVLGFFRAYGFRVIRERGKRIKRITMRFDYEYTC